MVFPHAQGQLSLANLGGGANINPYFTDLETAMAKDALKKHLSKRPEKEDLVQRASYLCQTINTLFKVC